MRIQGMRGKSKIYSTTGKRTQMKRRTQTANQRLIGENILLPRLEGLVQRLGGRGTYKERKILKTGEKKTGLKFTSGDC